MGCPGALIDRKRHPFGDKFRRFGAAFQKPVELQPSADLLRIERENGLFKASGSKSGRTRPFGPGSRLGVFAEGSLGG
jgi:hypothetical protein